MNSITSLDFVHMLKGLGQALVSKVSTACRLHTDREPYTAEASVVFLVVLQSFRSHLQNLE